LSPPLNPGAGSRSNKALVRFLGKREPSEQVTQLPFPQKRNSWLENIRHFEKSSRESKVGNGSMKVF
jgi:hypothetical protein